MSIDRVRKIKCKCGKAYWHNLTRCPKCGKINQGKLRIKEYTVTKDKKRVAEMIEKITEKYPKPDKIKLYQRLQELQKK